MEPKLKGLLCMGKSESGKVVSREFHFRRALKEDRQHETREGNEVQTHQEEIFIGIKEGIG
jgi:hypothetical protein